MKREKVIIDYNIRGWAEENESKIYKLYKKQIIVGEAKALPQNSKDEKVGAYAYRYGCDILTADNRAYVHYFKNKSVKFVKINPLDISTKGNQIIYIVRLLKK